MGDRVDAMSAAEGERRSASADERFDARLLEARAVIERKLSAKGLFGTDLEDAVGCAVQKLLLGLSHGGDVGGLLEYASTVAERAFVDHLRLKRPRWSSLKRRLLYLASLEGERAIIEKWDTASGAVIGLKAWRGRRFQPTDRYLDLRQDPSALRLRSLGGRDPSELSLAELVWTYFGWVRTPVEIDCLTNDLASILGLSEHSEEPLEGLTAAGRDPPAAEGQPFEEDPERIREKLWQEIRELPIRQRTALLLAMQREELLFLAGSVEGFANSVQATDGSRLDLWRSVPLKDREIGVMIGATSQQVSNLRKCARERLRRRLTAWEKEAW
jgi:hypothetical protein